MRKIPLLASAALATFLASCDGGSSGSTNPDTPPAQTTQVTGAWSRILATSTETDTITWYFRADGSCAQSIRYIHQGVPAKDTETGWWTVSGSSILYQTSSYVHIDTLPFSFQGSNLLLTESGHPKTYTPAACAQCSGVAVQWGSSNSPVLGTWAAAQGRDSLVVTYFPSGVYSESSFHDGSSEDFRLGFWRASNDTLIFTFNHTETTRARFAVHGRTLERFYSDGLATEFTKL